MLETTIALLLFLLPLAYSPGPGNIFFAAIGARFGLRACIPAIGGYHVATFVVTLSIGLGISQLANLSPFFFDVLRHAGAAYVFWLAWRFLRADAATGHTEMRRATALDGAILLLLNPKAYLIIALMFTQFLPVYGSINPVQVVWLTTVFTLNNLIAFTLWTLTGDLMLRRLHRAETAQRTNLFLAAILATVAFWIVWR